MVVYPWQQLQWRQLLTQFAQSRLPHAVLLQGSAGLGKLEFAKQFAKYLLCNNRSSEKACNQCPECLLWLADNHPDLWGVFPEATGKNIKIDQIREVITGLQKTTQRGGYHIAIIAPADALNRAAANALLKTLEEPAEKVILLLVSHRPGVLPATITSRCQFIRFTAGIEALPWLTQQLQALPYAMGDRKGENRDSPPSFRAIGFADAQDMNQEAIRESLAQSLLRVAEFAPLKAMELAAGDYFNLRNQVLSQLQTNSIDYPKSDLLVSWLDAFFSIAVDLLRLQLGANTQWLVNPDCAVQLHTLAKTYTRPRLLSLLSNLSLARQAVLNTQLHLNEQLLVDSLFINRHKENTCIL